VTSEQKIQKAAWTTFFVACRVSLATRLLIAGVFSFFVATDIRAQSSDVGPASGIASVEYYPSLNPPRMKTRLSGTEAQPLPGGLLAIKQLRLEMFNTNGDTNIVVTAPECVYNQLDGTASSAGPLQVRTGDGKFHVEGKGFLWRQSDNSLTISNQPLTVIEMGSEVKH
jgi:hypothetical protein